MRQQVADPRQHLLMTFQPRYADERVRHDEQRKVPPAAGRARVPLVVGAVIVDFQCAGEEILQPRPKRRRNIVRPDGHDCSGRYRATDATVPIAASMNSPMPPQTLKLTQASRVKFAAT